MILALLVIVPCCLVGLLVYAAMSRWELSSGPAPYGTGGGAADSRYGTRSLPRLTLRDTYLDWPVPQFARLSPSVLVAISVVAALWIVAWVVVFFVGLGMLHA